MYRSSAESVVVAALHQRSLTEMGVVALTLVIPFQDAVGVERLSRRVDPASSDGS